MQSHISIIEDIVQSYPELLEKRHAKQCKIMERSRRSRHDPTESAATVSLSKENEIRLKAIDAAIRQTYRHYDNGDLRMQLIHTTYWHKPPTAALENISPQTEQEWKKDFLRAVEQQMGFSDCNGCIYCKYSYGKEIIHICQYCYITGKLRVRKDGKCFSRRLSDGL